MKFDDMVCIAPVYVYRRNGAYHCNWSPKLPGGALIHGRGMADTPYIAIARAERDAEAQGWVRPT